MSKIDIVLNHIIEIKEDISGIKQHLKDMNGKVTIHDKDIKSNTKRIYWIIGIGSGITFMITLIGLILKIL